MSDEIKQYFHTGKKNLILIYILYLCGVVAPLLSVIAFIFAYVNQDSTNSVYRSHYVFALRTFWIGCISMVIWLIFTMQPLLAYRDTVIYLLIASWFVIRVVIALRMLINDQEHPDPNTWWF